jgi:hypothetical protein
MNRNAIPLAKSIAHAIGTELTQHPEHLMKGRAVRLASGRLSDATSDILSSEAVCWCLEALVAKHSPVNPYRDGAIGVFESALPPKHKGKLLCSWNDAPERTVQEVIDLCARVAVLPEGAGA